MKKASISKPVPDTSMALSFATQNPAGSPPEATKQAIGRPARGRHRQGGRTAQIAPVEAPKTGKRYYGGLVPPDDARLIANIRKELHRKLKIVAAERGTTMGSLIEELVEKHL